MSYAVTLGCGCEVYVACHPLTGAAHTRIIEQRAPGCTIRSHEVGVRLEAWELRNDLGGVAVASRRQALAPQGRE